MIVLPLFAGQYDNAQRLMECGLGARLDPYGFTDAQMHEALGRLLADGALRAPGHRRAGDQGARRRQPGRRDHRGRGQGLTRPG
jgi:UDP:flavonoid glycosyltransferase YjiC (YdhE family)